MPNLKFMCNKVTLLLGNLAVTITIQGARVGNPSLSLQNRENHGNKT